MRVTCCCIGAILIMYALNIAADTGSTVAIVVGTIGIGLLIFSDARR